MFSFIAGVGIAGYGIHLKSEKKNDKSKWPFLKPEFLMGCGFSIIMNSPFHSDPLAKLDQDSSHQEQIDAYRALAGNLAQTFLLHSGIVLLGATPASNYIERQIGPDFNAPLFYQGFCTTRILGSFVDLCQLSCFFNNIGDKIEKSISELVAAEVAKALSNVKTSLSIDTSTGVVELTSSNDKTVLYFCAGILVGCGLFALIRRLTRNDRYQPQQPQITNQIPQLTQT